MIKRKKENQKRLAAMDTDMSGVDTRVLHKTSASIRLNSDIIEFHKSHIPNQKYNDSVLHTEQMQTNMTIPLIKL